MIWLALALALISAEARADSPDDTPSPEIKIVKSIYSLTTFAGVSSISYRESGYSALSEIAITPKISYRLLLPAPHFDLGISGYGTAATVTSNQPGVVARFFGFNARLGYGGFQILPEPWKFSLMAGPYYTTMAVMGAPFGFSGLLGVQIYPAVRYAMANGDVASFALKFSPVGTLFSLSDREIAANAAWTRTIAQAHPLILSLDLADLRFTSGIGSAVSQSATVSAGYGW